MVINHTEGNIVKLRLKLILNFVFTVDLLAWFIFFFRSVIVFIGNRLLVLKGLPHLASLQLLSLLQPELEAGLLQVWVVEDLELLLL